MQHLNMQMLNLNIYEVDTIGALWRALMHCSGEFLGQRSQAFAVVLDQSMSCEFSDIRLR